MGKWELDVGLDQGVPGLDIVVRSKKTQGIKLLDIF